MYGFKIHPRVGPVWAVIVALAGPMAGGAQEIRCLVPFEATASGNPCKGRAVTGTSRQLIVVQVRNATGPVAPGTSVRVVASYGATSPNVTTGADGVASIRWTGAMGSSDLSVELAANVASDTVKRTVVLRPPAPVATPTPSATLEKPEHGSGNEQYWFEGFELLQPVRVKLVNPTNCSQTPVFFRPTSGGKASPDTVYGESEHGTCIAESRWTLDKRIGHQHLRVTTGGGGPGLVYEARARRLPRVFVGAHLGVRSGWTRLRSDPDTVIVTVVDSLGVQRVHKEIDLNNEPDDVASRLSRDPVVGLDFPLWYQIPWARLSAGVAIDDPTSEWFVGVSLFQLFQGFLQESMGIDLHLVANLAKRMEVMNLDDCVSDPATCRTESTRGLVGVGLMVVTDGAGVVSSLIKALGGG